MSFEAFVWAWRQPVTTSTDQHVLLALANIAPIRETFASATYIADVTRRSERHVRRSLVSLEAGGFITITDRPGRTDMIRLNIPEDFTVTMPPEGDLEKGRRGRPRKTPDTKLKNPGHEALKPPPLVSDEPLEEPIKGTSLVEVRVAPFDVFWSAYPVKKSKDAARLSFMRAMRRIEGEDPLNLILDGLARYVEEVARTGVMIKHPATWLNGGCWNDEPDPTNRSQTDGQSTRYTTDHAADRQRAREAAVVAGATEAVDRRRRLRWRL